MCGGADACVDCNNTVNGGQQIDSCGVCGGKNECLGPPPRPVSQAYPHVAFNVSIEGAPVVRLMTVQQRGGIRIALSQAFGIDTSSVDVLNVLDCECGSCGGCTPGGDTCGADSLQHCCACCGLCGARRREWWEERKEGEGVCDESELIKYPKH